MELERVDPELRDAIRRMPRIPFHWRSLVLLAQLLMPLRPRAKSLPGVRVSDETHGAARVRVYRPEPGTARAGLLWIHGGGMIIGDAALNDRECADVARELSLVVASVEYRLAPRHRFPAALDDCAAAWQWMVSSAGALGIDPARIAVAGESAGGGLAASLAQRIRDAGGVQPAAQLLLCPMLDDRTAARSELDRVDHFVWNNRSNRAGWSGYLGSLGAASLPAYASAARCTDLAGLPPAWIGVGDIDLFHDEDADYARRLRDAGVSCELHVTPGAPHGFEMLAYESAPARACFASAYAFLQRTLRL